MPSIDEIDCIFSRIKQCDVSLDAIQEALLRFALASALARVECRRHIYPFAAIAKFDGSCELVEADQGYELPPEEDAIATLSAIVAAAAARGDAACSIVCAQEKWRDSQQRNAALAFCIDAGASARVRILVQYKKRFLGKLEPIKVTASFRPGSGWCA